MDSSILIGSAIFSVIVLILVSLVLAARHWLMPAGTARLDINGRHFQAPFGRNLLRALADNGIYLPSPCAGRGLCGQCKIEFMNPPGAPLPTEMTHLSRREAMAGIRLACANKVRDNCALKIPEQYISVQRISCTVVSARMVSTYLREIILDLPPAATLSFIAGQYVLIYAPPYTARYRDFAIAPEYRSAWQAAGLLQLVSVVREPAYRAYSLANTPRDGRTVMLVVRIAPPPAMAPADVPPGQVSSFIYSLRPGDSVDIAGPFGAFRASGTGREMVLIAGGAGIAPMRAIILEQLSRAGPQVKISFWFGVRTAQDLCYVEEMQTLAAQHDNFRYEVALSDPQAADSWSGHRGFIHTVVYQQYLATHPAPEDLEYYLCGPPVMSKAVITMLEDLGVDSSSIYFDDFGAGQC